MFNNFSCLVIFFQVIFFDIWISIVVKLSQLFHAINFDIIIMLFLNVSQVGFILISLSSGLGLVFSRKYIAGGGKYSSKKCHIEVSFPTLGLIWLIVFAQ
jgi:hypothetical protein